MNEYYEFITYKMKLATDAGEKESLYIMVAREGILLTISI